MTIDKFDSTDQIEIYDQLKSGGDWLGSSRRWLQNNVKDGDRLCWSDSVPVSIPFCKFEDFARTVAIAAVAEDREKRKAALKRRK